MNGIVDQSVFIGILSRINDRRECFFHCRADQPQRVKLGNCKNLSANFRNITQSKFPIPNLRHAPDSLEGFEETRTESSDSLEINDDMARVVILHSVQDVFQLSP
jgi:hypothetical protein